MAGWEELDEIAEAAYLRGDCVRIMGTDYWLCGKDAILCKRVDGRMYATTMSEAWRDAGILDTVIRQYTRVLKDQQRLSEVTVVFPSSRPARRIKVRRAPMEGGVGNVITDTILGDVLIMLLAGAIVVLTWILAKGGL